MILRSRFSLQLALWIKDRPLTLWRDNQLKDRMMTTPTTPGTLLDRMAGVCPHGTHCWVRHDASRFYQCEYCKKYVAFESIPRRGETTTFEGGEPAPWPMLRACAETHNFPGWSCSRMKGHEGPCALHNDCTVHNWVWHQEAMSYICTHCNTPKHPPQSYAYEPSQPTAPQQGSTEPPHEVPEEITAKHIDEIGMAMEFEQALIGVANSRIRRWAKYQDMVMTKLMHRIKEHQDNAVVADLNNPSHY